MEKIFIEQFQASYFFALEKQKQRDEKKLFFNVKNKYIFLISSHFLQFVFPRVTENKIYCLVKKPLQRFFYRSFFVFYSSIFLYFLNIKRLRLVVIGSGYFFEKITTTSVAINLGCSHVFVVFLEPPLFFSLEGRKKKILSLWSFSLDLLQNTGAFLRTLRTPDSYKGKGLRYLREKLLLKTGKKKFV